MPHKSRNNQRMSQGNQRFQGDAQAGPIRKTILRNPEVPIRSQNLATSDDIPRQLSATWHDALSNQNQNTLAPPDSSRYHQPRLNKIAEMRRTLNDVKSYEAKTLESVHDLTKNSQQMVNREVRFFLMRGGSILITLSSVLDFFEAQLSIPPIDL